MPALHKILQAETSDLHEQLETLPFFQALRDGNLPAIGIVSLLRCLSILHAVLEQSIAEAPRNQFTKLFESTALKTPLLGTDLDGLDSAKVPSITAALQIALEYAAEIISGPKNLLRLVGILYVLEGSQNGGREMKRTYAHCLGVPEERLSYIGCYASETSKHWSVFINLLNGLNLEKAEAAEVVESAKRCFQQIGKIYAALFPYADDGLKYHVAAINSEAGEHAMPQSPAEIDLALRAGNAAWEKYPYLRLRFGDRGKRFTSSDSCWLVTLTDMPVETTTKSLAWLRTVLSSRGIPTIVLEGHLNAIADALAAKFPLQIERRARFDQFLLQLSAQRKTIVGFEAVPRLVKKFDKLLRACGGLNVDSAADLIASAWVDERSGIAGSLAAAEAWFVDRNRFSAEWIACVSELVWNLNEAGGNPC